MSAIVRIIAWIAIFSIFAGSGVRANTLQLVHARHGALTDQELKMAKAAWAYFEEATQKDTGLANSIATYPSTTMWDTASYLSALVSAYELGVIDRHEFYLRSLKVLGTLRDLDLFKGELPNKVYNTKTGDKVNYQNKKGEVGYSALDIGRLLVWLKIIDERYPELSVSAESVVSQWKFCNVITRNGGLAGAFLDKGGRVKYSQEGRLGYEEYAAKGFELWGFKADAARKPDPVAYVDIYGVNVPYDARDPRVYKTMNYVLTESYLLDGIELGWDVPGDRSSAANVFTDGWRAEFATRVYLAQQRRFEETGILTARSEHQVEGAPYFVYDTVFSDGYPWNTLDTEGNYVPDRAAVALKAALGMWVLWDSPYTDRLFKAVADLYEPNHGFFEGLYENGKGYIPLQTANNNGIILASLLFKVQGPILKWKNSDARIWPGSGEAGSLKCRPGTGSSNSCCCQAQSTKLSTDLALSEFKYCAVLIQAGQEIPGNIQVKDCGILPLTPRKAAPSTSSPSICTPPTDISGDQSSSDAIDSSVGQLPAVGGILPQGQLNDVLQSDGTQSTPPVENVQTRSDSKGGSIGVSANDAPNATSDTTSGHEGGATTTGSDPAVPTLPATSEQLDTNSGADTHPPSSDTMSPSPKGANQP